MPCTSIPLAATSVQIKNRTWPALILRANLQKGSEKEKSKHQIRNDIERLWLTQTEVDQ